MKPALLTGGAWCRNRTKGDIGINGLLNKVEVPKNHPWATTKGLTEEEEKERQEKVQSQKTRRRRASPDDLAD
jgi:hypothetical protein